MKKLMSSALAGAITILLGVSFASAQEMDLGKIVPADIFTCKYNEGMGSADLNGAIDSWNAYMDDNDNEDYAAWILSRYYYTAAQDFDFIWLGAWTDGNAMGAGTDMWLSTGGEYAGRFAEVATCNNHVNVASVNYKLPEGGTPENAVLTFSNCTIDEGSTYSEVHAATNEWAAALTEAGSESAIYHWFPVFGGANPTGDLDFVNTTAYPNHTALGADYERRTNGGMFRKYNELFDGKLDCDVTRVYNARSIRAAQLR